MAKKNDKSVSDPEIPKPPTYEQNIARIFGSLVNEIMDGIKQNDDGSMIYGINFKFAPDGTPIFDGFEKIDTREVVPAKIEPLIDIIDKKREVIVIADLREITMVSLGVTVILGKLTINIKDGQGNISDAISVSVPKDADPKRSSAKFNKGILEIRMRKGINTSESEYHIKVE